MRNPMDVIGAAARSDDAWTLVAVLAILGWWGGPLGPASVPGPVAAVLVAGAAAAWAYVLGMARMDDYAYAVEWDANAARIRAERAELRASRLAETRVFAEPITVHALEEPTDA